jgi:hypothetical protein
MGLRYVSANGGPICYESADVRLVDGVRDIPYEGTLSAVVAPTDSERDGCPYVGFVFDDRNTLIVDCLHDDSEVAAFHSTCSDNRITRVAELSAPIARPCPPPENQLQVEDWAAKLYSQLRSAS